MANPIAAVEVKVGVESAQVITGVNEARAAVRQGTAAIAADAKKGVGLATAEFGKFGKAVQGAPAAISAASNAMVAFGGKAAGAVNAVGGAIASLAASGFTPLGLAIAGVTVAFGAFASRSSEALDAVTEKIEKQRKALLDLGEEVDRLIVRRDAARAGVLVSDDAVKRQQRINDLMRERAELSRGLRPIDALRLPDPREDQTRAARIREETRARIERIQQIDHELALLRATEKATRQLAEAEKAIHAARERFKPTPPRFHVEETNRVLTPEELRASMGFQTRPTPLELEDRPIRPETPDTSAEDAFRAQVDRLREIDEERNELAERLRQSRITMEDLFGLGPETEKPEPVGPDPQVFAAATYAASGLTSALGDIARGTQSASEAFREFGIRFLEQVAQMIIQATVLRAIMSSLGFTQTATGAFVSSAPVPAAAHGGTFRVGGSGGLDSQLVALKASPGEMIRVTNGANSYGGDTPIALTVVNRPSPVFADEVAARMSSGARAGVVASALSRPGRRGRRAT